MASLFAIGRHLSAHNWLLQGNKWLIFITWRQWALLPQSEHFSRHCPALLPMQFAPPAGHQVAGIKSWRWADGRGKPYVVCARVVSARTVQSFPGLGGFTFRGIHWRTPRFRAVPPHRQLCPRRGRCSRGARWWWPLSKSAPRCSRGILPAAPASLECVG